MEKLLYNAIKAAFAAGKKINQHYSTNFDYTVKVDSTPLTIADKDADLIIRKGLSKSNFPIISEESDYCHEYNERKDLKYFWMVDPLDGTREFIKKNGEFSVNIALLENSIPVIGVIYLPAFDELYFAMKNGGAYKTEKASLLDRKSVTFSEIMGSTFTTLLPNIINDKLSLVLSHSFFCEKTRLWIDRKSKELNKQVDLNFLGSSYKACKIAEGVYNYYPRFGPSKEWDIAASYVIIKEAKADIIDLATNSDVQFNKNSLSNPDFLIYRNEK
ncbi:MAG: 3'(2'),5'-bisphosphate nucleotidase CysQ [Bacteroidales bacterium]